MINRLYLILKRTFDFCFALVGILATLSLWLIATVGILVSDFGPVFYKAKRVGKDGKTFTMYKFRSMRVPKEESEKCEASFKADTNRIFAFGEFMRKTKIDELPQFLNVLNGTMSVVGPRPAAPDQVEIMRGGKYSVAYKVRPGITSPSALYDYIIGDSVEDPKEYEELVLPTRLELEAYYPQHMSAGYDIKLIWWTVVCILATVFKKENDKILAELVGSVEIPQGVEAE